MASQALVSSTIKFCFSPITSRSSKQISAGLRSNRFLLVDLCQSDFVKSLARNPFLLGNIYRNKKLGLLWKTSRIAVYAEGSSVDSFSAIQTADSVDGKTGAKKKSEQHGLFRFLVVAIVVAATVSAVSLWKRSGINLNGQADGFLVSKDAADAQVHFSFNLFGSKLFLADHTPGWVYFWLLMAAGFGFFISEEALNVWVGATLGRMVSFDGSRESFFSSFAQNAPYIVSTTFWVYWGVCISDMVPFYAGKFAAKNKASDKLREKVGVSKEKLEGITKTIQRYGDLVGFVERLSLGVRNPTSFLAGALGIDPKRYFTGVCLGAFVTLPLQLGVGFALRQQPLAALAGVAAAVGLWTVLPYAVAGLASLSYVFRNKINKHN